MGAKINRPRDRVFIPEGPWGVRGEGWDWENKPRGPALKDVYEHPMYAGSVHAEHLQEQEKLYGPYGQGGPVARPSPQAPTSFVPSDTLSKSGPGFGGGSDFGYTTPYTMPSGQSQGYEPPQPVAALETPSTIKPPQSQKPVTAERQQAGPVAPEGSLTALGWPSTSQLIASVKAGRVSLQQAIQKLVYLKSVSQDAPTIAKVTAAIEVLRREFRSKPK